MREITGKTRIAPGSWHGKGKSLSLSLTHTQKNTQLAETIPSPLTQPAECVVVSDGVFLTGLRV